jgi:hypothetical protein
MGPTRGAAEYAEYLGIVSRGRRPCNRLWGFFEPRNSEGCGTSGSAGRTASTWPRLIWVKRQTAGGTLNGTRALR